MILTILASQLDSGTFGYSDTLDVVVEYAFIPQVGDARTYRLMLDFYSSPGEYRAQGVSQVLTASEGAARLAIPATKLPFGPSQGEPGGYIVRLAFVRTETRTDYIYAGPFRPIVASFSPDP